MILRQSFLLAAVARYSMSKTRNTYRAFDAALLALSAISFLKMFHLVCRRTISAPSNTAAAFLHDQFDFTKFPPISLGSCKWRQLFFDSDSAGERKQPPPLDLSALLDTLKLAPAPKPALRSDAT